MLFKFSKILSIWGTLLASRQTHNIVTPTTQHKGPFCHPPKSLLPWLHGRPLPPTQPPAPTHLSLSLFIFSGLGRKWNQACMRSLARPGFLHLECHLSRCLPLCVRTPHPSTTEEGPSSPCTTAFVSTHLLVEICVVSSFE